MKCPPNCGLCCKHVDQVPQIRHLANPDGSCRHLTSDNQCGIYDARPDICNNAWVKAYAFQDISQAEFEERTILVCRARGAKI